MKLSLRRKQHVNTGNFGSMDSDVMIEIDIADDASTKETFNKMKALSELIDGVQAIEMISGLQESISARADAVEYLEALQQNEDNIKISVAKSLKTLKNTGN